MPEANIIYSPRHHMRVNKIKLTQKRGDEFMALVEGAYVEKPDKKDLQKIREFLVDFPELCKAVFGLAEAVQETLVKNMFDQDVPKIAIEEYTVTVREEFGYHDAPIMEKLLIENIVIAWLRMYWLEYQLVLRMGQQQINYASTEFWERRLTMAQKRYLRACETLAKIRKMAVPAFQLNIGDKQINVAGDLKANRRREARIKS